MIHDLRKAALLGCVIACVVGLTSRSALAQGAPPPAATPRCGGLVCDLGIIGGSPSEAAAGLPDKTALPCNDFLCRAFGGGRNAQAAPPVAVAEPEPAKPMKKTRRKRVAKTASKTAADPETKPGTKSVADTKAPAGSPEPR